MMTFFRPFKRRLKSDRRFSQNTKETSASPASPKAVSEKPSRRFAQFQAETLLHPQKTSWLEKLYAPYQAPPGVRGDMRDAGMAMDETLNPPMEALSGWMGQHHNPQNILKAAFEDGLVFLGYPTLAEMANRPELRKPCHVIAREALREGFSFHATGSGSENRADKIKALEQEFERLNVSQLLQKMAEQALFYGISHLFVSLEGEPLTSQSQSAPLSRQQASFQKGALKEFRLIEPIWMTPNGYRADSPLHPDYYRPEHWWVQGVLVHRSRLLQMVPYEVSDLLKPAFNFGGLSLTQQLKPYAYNYLRIRNSVSNIVANFSKLVLQTDMAANLSAPEEDMLTNSVDASALSGRARLLNALSEGQDTIIADKESEEVKIVSAPLGGLDHLQAQSMEAQAAIPGIPLVKLFGVTPTGLNASSEGEIRVFYDEIKSFQQANLRPVLEGIFKLCQLNLWGEIDPSLSFSFAPLWQLDPQEKAALEKSKADIDALNLKGGVITPQEARARQQSEKDSIYGAVDLSAPLPKPPQAETALPQTQNPAEAKETASEALDPAPEALAQDREWDESKHPRNLLGQFAHSAGEAGSNLLSASSETAGKTLHSIAQGAKALNAFIGQGADIPAENNEKAAELLGTVGHALNPFPEAEAAGAAEDMEKDPALSALREKLASAASPEEGKQAIKAYGNALLEHKRADNILPRYMRPDETSSPEEIEKILDFMKNWGSGRLRPVGRNPLTPETLQGLDQGGEGKTLEAAQQQSLLEKIAAEREALEQETHPQTGEKIFRQTKWPELEEGAENLSGKDAKFLKNLNPEGNEEAALRLMAEPPEMKALGTLGVEAGDPLSGMRVFGTNGYHFYTGNKRKLNRGHGTGFAHMEARHGQHYADLELDQQPFLKKLKAEMGEKSYGKMSNAEKYARFVLHHADQTFPDPAGGRLLTAVTKTNPANPTVVAGKNPAHLALDLRWSPAEDALLAHSGYKIGERTQLPDQDEIARKIEDRPAIAKRLEKIPEIAQTLGKIKDPELQKSGLTVANQLFHDMPPSATFKDSGSKRTYEYRAPEAASPEALLEKLHTHLKTASGEAETGQGGAPSGKAPEDTPPTAGKSAEAGGKTAQTLKEEAALEAKINKIATLINHGITGAELASAIATRGTDALPIALAEAIAGKQKKKFIRYLAEKIAKRFRSNNHEPDMLDRLPDIPTDSPSKEEKSPSGEEPSSEEPPQSGEKASALATAEMLALGALGGRRGAKGAAEFLSHEGRAAAKEAKFLPVKEPLAKSEPAKKEAPHTPAPHTSLSRKPWEDEKGNLIGRKVKTKNDKIHLREIEVDGDPMQKAQEMLKKFKQYAEQQGEKITQVGFGGPGKNDYIKYKGDRGTRLHIRESHQASSKTGSGILTFEFNNNPGLTNILGKKNFKLKIKPRGIK